MSLAATLQSQSLAIGSAVVSRGSVYAVMILAAHFLSPSDFGLFVILVPLAGSLNALISGGGDMWLNRFARQRDVSAGRAPYSARMYLMLCGGIAALPAVLAIVFATTLRDSFHGAGLVIAVALAGAVFSGLSESVLAVLRLSGRTRLFFVLRDLMLPLGYVLAVALYGPARAIDVLSIHASLWFVALVLLALILFVCRSRFLPMAGKRPNRIWPIILRHTGGFWFGNFTARLLANVDIVFLTWIISIVTVGEYRLAAQIAIGFLVVQHFVFLALPWQLRRRANTVSDRVGVAHIAIRQRLLLLAAAAAVVLLSLFAEPLLALLQERFRDVSAIFVILLILRFSELLWGPQHETLVSNGRVYQDALTNVFGLLIWPAVFFLSLQFLSPLGSVLVANVAGVATQQGTRYAYLRRGDLACPTGHPFGPAAPLLISAAVIVGSIVYVG